MNFGVSFVRRISFFVFVCSIVILGIIVFKYNGSTTYTLERPSVRPPLLEGIHDVGLHSDEIPRTNLAFKHSCSLPAGGYKAWSQGVVTVMKPVISRNCAKLFQGDQIEAKRVEQENKAWDSTGFSNYFDEWAMSGGCDRIRRELTNNLYTTKEELEFPLAFSMNIHDNPQQILRFLKVIYRPHNLYCLHYDKKAGDKIKTVMENVARCLDNVIVPQTHVNVVYGCYTIMEAQLVCMRELLKARNAVYSWRYTISLCGKELPLRTLREIVVMLKRLNGTSGLPQHEIPRDQLNSRFSKKAAIGPNNKCVRTNQNLGPPPRNVEIRKSLAYFSLTPDFVHYLLNNRTSLDLYEYMKGAFNSEEHYFSTVYYMKGEANYMYLDLCSWHYNIGVHVWTRPQAPPSFSVLDAEKREGVVREIVCVFRWKGGGRDIIVHGCVLALAHV